MRWRGHPFKLHWRDDTRQLNVGVSHTKGGQNRGGEFGDTAETPEQGGRDDTV